MSLSLSCAELEAARSARDRPGVFDERIRPNLLAQIIFVPGVPKPGAAPAASWILNISYVGSAITSQNATIMLERVVPFISNVFYPVVPRIEMPKMVEWLRTVGAGVPSWLQRPCEG